MSTADTTAQLARDMVRLERQAKHEASYGYTTAYWTSQAWQQREEVRKRRSTMLRVLWRERERAHRSRRSAG